MQNLNPNSVIKPVNTAYVSKKSATCARNYDEFQSDDEIRDILKENPDSILSVTMAHCNTDSTYDDPYLDGALELADRKLKEFIAKGTFQKTENIFYVYKIDVAAKPGTCQIGIGGYVPTKLIRDEKNPNGKVIRNEAIFVEKAAGRAALIGKTKSLIGTVNLCTVDPEKQLEKLLHTLSAGEPTISAFDEKKDKHSVYVINDSATIEKISSLFENRELFVADGNHRSKAAQMVGCEHFLAVVFCAQTMNIDPYHRLVSGTNRNATEILELFKKGNFSVTPVSVEKNPDTMANGYYLSNATHKIGLFTGKEWYEITPQNINAATPRESIDAQIIEERIFKSGLSLDPACDKIAYVGGDYNPGWLMNMVKNGKADFALSMPPMTMKEFIAINESREFLPRKTTWFTPKIRSGLVIALF